MIPDCLECLANQLATMHGIANQVEGLDLSRGIGVELQLGHGELPVRFLSDVENDRY